MGRGRSYSDADIKVIRKHINNHPENLQKAFTLAGRELGRTPGAIENAYYKKDSRVALALSKEIVTMSKKKVMHGRKNTSKYISPKDIIKQKVNQILDILFDD